MTIFQVFHDFVKEYKNGHHNSGTKAEPDRVSRVSYFLFIKYFTAIGGLPVSLCVKSIGNQHIFLKRNGIDIYKNSKFHDFSILPNFHFP